MVVVVVVVVAGWQHVQARWLARAPGAHNSIPCNHAIAVYARFWAVYTLHVNLHLHELTFARRPSTVPLACPSMS